MREELKPCPFCGSSALVASEPDTNDFGVFRFVECMTCRARSGGKFHSHGNDCPQTYAEVRAAWNRREGERELVEALERIANGREVRRADGTTEVEDVPDAAEIARQALAKHKEQQP